MSETRPIPQLDSNNRPYWTGGSKNQLLIMQCRDCGTYMHPPRDVCRGCLSDRVEPQAVAGTGEIETFTINRQRWLPDLETPYVIARVSLDGVPDVVLTTNIVGCDVDEVDIGDRVCVVFEQHGEIFVPLFEKVA